MKRISTVLLSAIILCSLLTGCEKSDGSGASGESEITSAITSGSENVQGSAGAPVQVDEQSDDDMFTKRDLNADYNESESVIITLSGSTATTSSDSVKISGSTITITEEATYIISGTLDDGMIIVDAPDTAKLQLVLKNASISSKASAPLYIKQADKVFVTLADGTKNTLESGEAFTAIDENNIDAAIFSKQDLTLNGSGSLAVTSPAGHGIVSKDDLVITGGTYTVESASHGIDANDSVRITNASLTVDAGKDGIHAENDDDASKGFVYISSGTFDIEAEGDGISAGAYLQVKSGTIGVTAGGGSENGSKASSDNYGSFRGGRTGGASPTAASSTGYANGSTSMKGIKAEGAVLISDGAFTINSADDAIHSNTSVTVNGGTFELASGDDGIHADDSLLITAGNINITESYEGLEALSVEISGGDIKLVATDDGINGAGGMDSSGMGGRDGNFGNKDGEFGGFGGFGGHGGGRVPEAPNGEVMQTADTSTGATPGKTKPDGMGGGNGGMGGGNGGISGGGSVTISGGSIYVEMGGDGLDANGSLTITGGTITVSGANVGDTSILDYDSTGTISGGTFIGTGATSMAQNFGSASEQGAIMLSTGNQPSGTSIKLTDQSGKELVSYTANRDFSCVIISHEGITDGGKYTLTVGSSSTEITMSGTVYGSGNGMGGGIGGHGGRW